MNENEKARGEGFFAKLETQPYQPPGNLLGQFYDDSCVAACCRMLLRAAVGEVAEAELRAALQTERGAYLSVAPAVLRQFGLPGYVYRPTLALTELRAATVKGPALVAVKQQPDEVDAHALVIDRITEEAVFIRDPLPAGAGSAYRVTVETFLKVWLRSPAGQDGTGRAAVVE